MIRAVVFDIGNVLLPFDFSRMVRWLEGRCEKPVEEIRAAMQRLDLPYELGALSRAEFLSHLADALALRASREELAHAWCAIFTENLPMTALVRQLHGRLPLYLLSNTNELHMEYAARTFPVFQCFHGAVFSFEVQCRKPDRAIFELTARRFQLEPSETVYLDDLEPNVAAAREVGFQAFLYDWRCHEALLAWLAPLLPCHG